MIYLDNAATSYPKPKQVLSHTFYAMKNLSFNSGRGGYKQSLAAAEKIYSIREKIGEFFSFSPERIIFTKNCTEALNTAILGSIKKGDHVVISSLEHNSVARVVEKLKNDGIITYSIAKYSYDENETLSNFKNAIRPNTSLVVCMYASNTFGVVLPIAKIGKLCRDNGIRFIVDAAQGAGIADIDAARDNIDILCAPGHKCLYGAMGTGFLALSNNIELDSTYVGGTGSSSLSLNQPSFYPDKLEAGTLNNPGIISIGEGIDYINSVGRRHMLNHELAICDYIHSSLKRMDIVELYTPAPSKIAAMPIVSFNIKDMTSESVANELGRSGICVRAGYHCSPLAHTHFGTSKNGTVRISPGYFTTEQECYKFINVVKNLIN